MQRADAQVSVFIQKTCKSRRKQQGWKEEYMEMGWKRIGQRWDEK